MNIKTRLKRLETGLKTDALFCACYPAYHTEIYFQDLGEDAETSEPKLSGARVPDVCLRCRKPIIKQVIIIQGVDHTTKTRYPNEWKR